MYMVHITTYNVQNHTLRDNKKEYIRSSAFMYTVIIS